MKQLTFIGRIGDKFIMVPIDTISLTIITIRPMRKGEKAIFLSEVKNG